MNMGLRGLMYGLGAAFLAQFFMYTYMYYKLDWNKQAAIINSSMGEDSNNAGVEMVKKGEGYESANSEKETGLGIGSDANSSEEERDSLTRNEQDL
jgi:hypothetical protein